MPSEQICADRSPRSTENVARSRTGAARCRAACTITNWRMRCSIGAACAIERRPTRFWHADVRESIDPTRLPDFERAVERIAAAVRDWRNDRNFWRLRCRRHHLGRHSRTGAARRPEPAIARTFASPLEPKVMDSAVSPSTSFSTPVSTLLVALDCGSSDHGKVAYARALGYGRGHSRSSSDAR